INRISHVRNLQRDVVQVTEQKLVKCLDRNRLAVKIETQPVHLEVLQLDCRRQAFKSHLQRGHNLRLHIEKTVIASVLEIGCGHLQRPQRHRITSAEAAIQSIGGIRERKSTRLNSS